ncbi:unnamed protein product, partial [Closterium sp. Naga37s-1]
SDDGSVTAFLSSFPLPLILRALDTGPSSQTQGMEEEREEGEGDRGVSEAAMRLQQAAVQALFRVFKSKVVLPVLPSLLPYAEKGMLSPSPDMRRLCCFALQRMAEGGEEAMQELRSQGERMAEGGEEEIQELARLQRMAEGGEEEMQELARLQRMAEGGEEEMQELARLQRMAEGGEEEMQELARRMAEGGEEEMQELGSQGEVARRVVGEGLVRCLGDEHLPVAAAATDALAAFCRSALGVSLIFSSDQLYKLTRSSHSQVQQRVVEAALRLANQSQHAMSAVEKLDLLQPLVAELQGVAGMGESGTEEGGGTGGGASEEGGDALAALAACELVSEFTSSRVGVELLEPRIDEIHEALVQICTKASTPAPAAAEGEAPSSAAAAARPAAASLHLGLDLLLPAALKCAARLTSPATPGVMAPLTLIQADEVAALFNSICEAWGRSEEHVRAETVEGFFDALATYARSTHGTRLLLNPRRHVISFVLKRAFGGCGPHTSLHTASLHALASVFGADRVEGSENVQMVPVHATHSGISGVDEGGGGGARGGGVGMDLEVGDDGETKLKEETFAAAAKAPGGPTLAGVFVSLLKRSEEIRVAVYRLLAAVVEREWAAVELCGDWGLVQMVTDAQAERHKAAMDWRHSCCVAMSTAAEAQHASISFNCTAQLAEAVCRGPYLRPLSWSPLSSANHQHQHPFPSPLFPPLLSLLASHQLAEAVNGNDQLLPDYTIEVVPVNTSLSTTQAASSGATLSRTLSFHAIVVVALSHPPCSGADNAGREGGGSSEPSLPRPPSSPPHLPPLALSHPPAVVQTMLAERVVAAVGPMTSSQAHVLSAIHTQVQVPMVSYSATDPSLSAASYPFFTRTIRSDALEMQAIADLVTHFSWLEVITIYSDDDYGRNGVNQLAVLLDKASVDVVKSIAVPLDASLSDIIVRLLAAQKLESTVFILQLNLELIVPVLTAASEVGMMTPGYVWIATEGVVAELENLPELSTEGMIGTRVFVPPNPQLSEFESAWQADGDGNATNGGAAFDQLSEFERAWQADGDGNATNGGVAFDQTLRFYPNSYHSPPVRLPSSPPSLSPPSPLPPSTVQTTTLYTLFAFDSLSLIARSIHALLYPTSPPPITTPPPAANGNASGSGSGVNSTGRLAGAEAATGGVGAGAGGTNGGVVGLERWQAVQLPKGGGASTDLARLQENLDGSKLMEAIIRSTFEGVTGRVSLDALGDRNGTSFEIVNAVNGRLRSIGYWTTDNGLASSLEPTSTSKDSSQSVLAGVIWPGGVSFLPRGWFPRAHTPLKIAVPYKQDFTQFVQIATNDTITGFCVEVFRAAVGLLPYTLDFEFVPYGVGNQSLSYTDMLRLVANKTFDGAVGDITITQERQQLVQFTQPVQSASLSMAVAQEPTSTGAWSFLSPFSLTMWLVILASTAFTVVAVWFLEKNQNEDFYAHGKLSSQIIDSVWYALTTIVFAQDKPIQTTMGRLAMMCWLFLVLIVTASYTASLSSILTVQNLAATPDSLSVAISLKLPLGYHEGSFTYNYLLAIGIPASVLFPLGSMAEFADALGSGKVKAVIDEAPYLDVFNSRFCSYTRVKEQLSTFNWGFAFHKDMRVPYDLSVAISKLAQSGQLQSMHDFWIKGSTSCSLGPSVSSTSLGPENFWTLLAYTGYRILSYCRKLEKELKEELEGGKAGSSRKGNAEEGSTEGSKGAKEGGGVWGSMRAGVQTMMEINFFHALLVGLGWKDRTPLTCTPLTHTLFPFLLLLFPLSPPLLTPTHFRSSRKGKAEEGSTESKGANEGGGFWGSMRAGVQTMMEINCFHALLVGLTGVAKARTPQLRWTDRTPLTCTPSPSPPPLLPCRLPSPPLLPSTMTHYRSSRKGKAEEGSTESKESKEGGGVWASIRAGVQTMMEINFFHALLVGLGWKDPPDVHSALVQNQLQHIDFDNYGAAAGGFDAAGGFGGGPGEEGEKEGVFNRVGSMGGRSFKNSDRPTSSSSRLVRRLRSPGEEGERAGAFDRAGSMGGRSFSNADRPTSSSSNHLKASKSLKRRFSRGSASQGGSFKNGDFRAGSFKSTSFKAESFWKQRSFLQSNLGNDAVREAREAREERGLTESTPVKRAASFRAESMRSASFKQSEAFQGGPVARAGGFRSASVPGGEGIREATTTGEREPNGPEGRVKQFIRLESKKGSFVKTESLNRPGSGGGSREKDGAGSLGAGGGSAQSGSLIKTGSFKRSGNSIGAPSFKRPASSREEGNGRDVSGIVEQQPPQQQGQEQQGPILKPEGLLKKLVSFKGAEGGSSTGGSAESTNRGGAERGAGGGAGGTGGGGQGGGGETRPDIKFGGGARGKFEGGPVWRSTSWGKKG